MKDSIARLNTYLQVKNCTPASIYRYNRDVRHFLEHCGIEDPQHLEAQLVRDYLLFLMNDEMLSPSTCKNTLAILRTFFKTGLERPDALAHIPWPKVPWTLPDIWTSQELETLFLAIDNLRFQTLLLTAYATGMRISEVCHLQVSDVDRARGVIHVRLGKGKMDLSTRHISKAQSPFDLLNLPSPREVRT